MASGESTNHKYEYFSDTRVRTVSKTFWENGALTQPFIVPREVAASVGRVISLRVRYDSEINRLKPSDYHTYHQV